VNDDLGLPIPDAVLAAAEAAINALLRLDPEGAARLGPVAGRVLRVEFTGLGSRIDVVPGERTLALFGDYGFSDDGDSAAGPDCIVRATPAALLRMTLAKHREDAIFAGSVQIEGDNRLAQTLGEVIHGLDIDWEEQLARVVGDTLAHRIGVQARAGGRWAQRTSDVLTENLHEYLIEEWRLLPGPTELQAFCTDVDLVRDDIERLEARVLRLERQRPAAGGSHADTRTSGQETADD